MHGSELPLSRSRELYELARKHLAGGVSSHFRALGAPLPLFFTHAKGARICDADGNEYLDFALGQGPLILGHSHDELLERVFSSLRKGQLYAGQHEMELELGQRFTSLVPNAGLVRFCNSGSEAVHIAIRLARAITGRRKILKFEGHYHGWFDNVLISVHPSTDLAGSKARPTAVPWGLGQPASALEEIVVCGWNDLEAVERAFRENGDIAAVITEPIMCNTGCILPESGFLGGLREVTNRHGALLIFDEIITGFRLAPGGAQEYFGVTADLATFGKAMSCGFPISAITGKDDHMQWLADGRVIHAGTLNGNNGCVAACLATTEILMRNGGTAYRQLFRIGGLLKTGLEELARKHNQPLLVQGPGPMIHTGFTGRPSVRNFRESADYDRHLLSKFVLGMFYRGVRLIERGMWYVSLAHSEREVETALEAADSVLSEI